MGATWHQMDDGRATAGRGHGNLPKHHSVATALRTTGQRTCMYAMGGLVGRIGRRIAAHTRVKGVVVGGEVMIKIYKQQKHTGKVSLFGECKKN